MLKRGLPKTIKTDLLFGELELVAERTALHHLKKSCRVSLLDRMKQHLTGEAEVTALAQWFERFVLRPDLEIGKELAEQLENLSAYLSQNPKHIENIRANAATLAHYSKQDMFGANVGASLPLCFVQRK